MSWLERLIQSKTYKSILGIICIGIIFLIALVSYRSESGSTVKVYEIVKTNTGFAPSALVVNEHSKVVFINNSDTPTWPASNSHPDHTGYPIKDEQGCGGSAFDACTALAPGEQWTFTFTQAGSWSYHDHLSPGEGGLIMVTNTSGAEVADIRGRTDVTQQDIDTFTEPTVEDFFALPEEEQFRIVNIYSRKAPQAAWGFLHDIGFSAYIEAGAPLHEFAHIVGAALYQTYGLNSFAMCDPGFAYGCYHAIINEAIKKTGANNLTNIVERCKKNEFTDGGSQPELWCYHGVGHGIATLNNFVVTTSLQDCDSLVAGTKERNMCYRGVYMDADLGPFGSFDLSSIWEDCAVIEDQYQHACGFFRVFTAHEKKFFTQDPTSLQRTCEAAPTEILKLSCIAYVAQQQEFLPTEEVSLEELEMQCDYFTEQNDRNDCLMASALFFSLNRYGNPASTTMAKAQHICQLLPENDLQTKCTKTVEVDRLHTPGLEFLDLFPTWRK